MQYKVKIKELWILAQSIIIGQWMLNFDYGPCVVSDWSVGPYKCNDVNCGFSLRTTHYPFNPVGLGCKLIDYRRFYCTLPPPLFI